MRQQNIIVCAIFDVFPEVKIWILVFRVVIAYSSVGGYQRFVSTYLLHVQGRRVLFMDVFFLARYGL